MSTTLLVLASLLWHGEPFVVLLRGAPSRSLPGPGAARHTNDRLTTSSSLSFDLARIQAPASHAGIRDRQPALRDCGSSPNNARVLTPAHPGSIESQNFRALDNRVTHRGVCLISKILFRIILF